MDERALAERLIRTTRPRPTAARAAAFVKGWLEARDDRASGDTHSQRPARDPRDGRRRDDGPTRGLPRPHRRRARRTPEQFEPRIEGDRLIGRGAYDMKGGLAAMMCAAPRRRRARTRVRVRFLCVPDEESEDVDAPLDRRLVATGFTRRLRDHRRADRPAHRRPGQGRARDPPRGHGRAAHGSTPWLGDNAVLKADRRLPPNRDAAVRARVLGAVRPPVDQPRPDRRAATRFNKVPDRCAMDVDIRYLPGQDPEAILAQIRAIGDIEVVSTFIRVPAIVSRTNPYVLALRDAVGALGRAARR